MYGVALQGFALVSEGDVRGMRLLDEATTAAVGGEMNQTSPQ